MPQIKDFHIGQMRYQATFQSNAPIDNASGGQDDDYYPYRDVFSCRCKLETYSSSKKDEQGQLLFNQGTRIVFRYSLPFAIDSDTRVVINNIIYRINGWSLIDQIKHYYQADVSVFQNAG